MQESIPINVADKIEYQEGSVVSKTLLKKSSGSVTLFAFDKGQGLSEHKAPYEAIVMVVDGTAEVTIAGELKVVKSGQMILMPADIPHALAAPGRFKMLLTMIRED